MLKPIKPLQLFGEKENDALCHLLNTMQPLLCSCHLYPSLNQEQNTQYKIQLYVLVTAGKVCEEEHADSIEKVGGGYGKGYIAAAEHWRKLCLKLAKLRDTKGHPYRGVTLTSVPENSR